MLTINPYKKFIDTMTDLHPFKKSPKKKKQGVERGVCPVCDRSCELTQKNQLKRHPPIGLHCPGSGSHP